MKSWFCEIVVSCMVECLSISPVSDGSGESCQLTANPTVLWSGHLHIQSTGKGNGALFLYLRPFCLIQYLLSSGNATVWTALWCLTEEVPHQGLADCWITKLLVRVLVETKWSDVGMKMCKCFQSRASIGAVSIYAAEIPVCFNLELVRVQP